MREEIPGFSPTWQCDLDALIAQARLDELLGRRVEAIWTLWSDDAWVDRAPVVIAFEDVQLEVCAKGMHSFSVSRDGLDLALPILTGAGALRWQIDRHHEFRPAHGRMVTAVGAIEYQLPPRSQSRMQRESVVSGVYFRFGDLHLEIFNGLDCNKMSNSLDRDHPVRYVLLGSGS